MRCSEGWGSHVSYKIVRMRLIYDLFGVSNLVYSGQVAESFGEDVTLTGGGGGVGSICWIDLSGEWIMLINSGPCAVGSQTWRRLRVFGTSIIVFSK